jgi:hypothetical protein
MGEIAAAFDGNPDSLIRSLEANPLVLELTFPQPRTLNSVIASVGGAPTTFTVRLIPSDGSAEQTFSTQAGVALEVRQLALDFGAPLSVAKLIIEVKNTNEGEPAHVHLWEISLR